MANPSVELLPVIDSREVTVWIGHAVTAPRNSSTPAISASSGSGRGAG
jgi:hypothetical protein